MLLVLHQMRSDYGLRLESMFFGKSPFVCLSYSYMNEPAVFEVLEAATGGVP